MIKMTSNLQMHLRQKDWLIFLTDISINHSSSYTSPCPALGRNRCLLLVIIYTQGRVLLFKLVLLKNWYCDDRNKFLLKSPVLPPQASPPLFTALGEDNIGGKQFYFLAISVSSDSMGSTPMVARLSCVHANR